MRKLIGITGYARTGKDTFFNRSKRILEKEGQKATRLAFADALKKELDSLLVKHTGISAFTEDNEYKELIRPLLVTYGTHVRRKLNQNCWIESIQPYVKNLLSKNHYVFITDVRFNNEAEWIKMNGGTLVSIDRLSILPANNEEHRERILMKKYIDYKISWPTFGEENIEQCDEYIIPNLSHITQSMKEVNQATFKEVM